MPVLVGTSGWQYADWRDVLYPDGLPQRLWLESYAESFATVENNGAFYRLPRRETVPALPRGRRQAMAPLRHQGPGHMGRPGR